MDKENVDIRPGQRMKVELAKAKAALVGVTDHNYLCHHAPTDECLGLGTALG